MELITVEVTTPLSGKLIKIKEGDGYTERLLLKKGKRLHQVIPDYLASLLVEMDGNPCKTSDVMQFLVPDYEFLLIEAYKNSFGDDLNFFNVCSTCGQMNSHTVNLTELPMLPLPENCTGGSDPVIDLVLPRAKLRARVGFLTVQNDMILNEQISAAGSIDLNQSDYLSLRMLEGCDPVSYEDVVKLPLMDHKALRKARRELVAGYDPLISLVCESCGNYDVTNILGLRDFLFPSG